LKQSAPRRVAALATSLAVAFAIGACGTSAQQTAIAKSPEQPSPGGQSTRVRRANPGGPIFLLHRHHTVNPGGPPIFPSKQQQSLIKAKRLNELIELLRRRAAARPVTVTIP
jgi:hypothetical protein